MKKILFVLGFLLIAVSLAVAVWAFAVADWDIRNFDKKEFLTNEYTFNGESDKIFVETNTADVVFMPSENGETKVVCFEETKMNHKVSFENGTLSIKLIDTRKWYNYISFFSFKSPKITVYLSSNEYTSLVLKGDTCDISVGEQFKFDTAAIELDTGDTTFKASTKTSLKIESDTGDITLGGSHSGSVELDTDTGDIKIQASCDGANLNIETNNGKLEIKNTSCANLSIETNTGDVELESLVAAEKIRIETDTGDVDLLGCDAKDITIETDTGDVEGTLLSDKHFIVKSKTGKKNYPMETASEQKCRITTDTGDINIRIR